MSKEQDLPDVVTSLEGRGMLAEGAQVTNTKERKDVVYEVQKVDLETREVILKSCNHYRAWGAIISRPKFDAYSKRFVLVAPAPVESEDGGKAW